MWQIVTNTKLYPWTKIIPINLITFQNIRNKLVISVRIDILNTFHIYVLKWKTIEAGFITIVFCIHPYYSCHLSFLSYHSNTCKVYKLFILTISPDMGSSLSFTHLGRCATKSLYLFDRWFQEIVSPNRIKLLPVSKCQYAISKKMGFDRGLFFFQETVYHRMKIRKRCQQKSTILTLHV